MPAYTTISCEFEKHARDRLVPAFYAALLGEDVAFEHVFPWGCDPDMPFDQIVAWNQSKLDADFMLGFDQHVANDYRQILVTVRPFSQCRIFLMNKGDCIEFHCIVPEEEITAENCELLLKACLRVWSQLPVRAIESYGEIDSNIGYEAIKSGERPSASLFAIVDHDCRPYAFVRDFQLTALNRGYLLTPRR